MLLADVRALFDYKVRSGLFARLGRHAQKHIREDRMQDAIGMTWIFFRDAAMRGEIPGDGLLYNYCSNRVRERGPRLARSGEPTKARAVTSVDGLLGLSLDVDAMVDVNAAVDSLCPEDRDLLIARAHGYDLDAIGADDGLSKSWTCRRVQAAREKLRRRLNA